jgi:hypothetical protein
MELILAQVRLARRAWGYEYTLGRSTPPPGPLTEMPGVTLNSYGRGATLYYTVRLGLHYDRLGHSDYAELLLRPLSTLIPPPPVRVDAPDTVQAEAYRLEGGYLVHLVNHTYNQRFLDAPIGAARQPLPPFDPTYSIHPIRSVIRVPKVRLEFEVEHGSYVARGLIGGWERRVNVAPGGQAIVEVDALGEYEGVALLSSK